MQISAQIVLAAIAAGSALGAPLPEPWKGGKPGRFDTPGAVKPITAMADHLPKINGGLALTAGGLGIGAGIAAMQNNQDASQPAAAPASKRAPPVKMKPTWMKTSWNDKKTSALNGGVGTVAGLAGVGGASYGLYNALNPADPAPAPAPAPSQRSVDPELEELQRRLNPAMAGQLALGGLMMGGPSIDSGNQDVTQQTWTKGAKTSGATSRRDVGDDADLLNRRLLSFSDTQISQTAQGGADGGKASGAASGTHGSLFAGGDNGSGLFGKPAMAAQQQQAKRLFQEEEPSLQRRLMFGLDTQHEDVTQQQWLQGGKTSGATS